MTTTYDYHLLWNSQLSFAAVAAALTGIITNDATLKDRAARYVRGAVLLGAFPNGAVVDQDRWSDCGPPCVGSAWGHAAGALDSYATIADAFARTGDTSLYTYTTSAGTTYGGSNGGSIRNIFVHTAKLANLTLTEYGTNGSDGGSLTDAYRITWNRPDGPDYTDFSLMPANIYYQDSNIRTAMTRNALSLTSCRDGSHGCFGGAMGNFPDVPFMFSNLDSGQINPYTTGGPTPTPTPTPTPSPTPTPQQAPIAWWKLDESTGTTASDASGSNHPGTLQNGPVWNPSGGRVNGALSLDGIDDHIQISGLLGSPQSLTLSGWANLSGTDALGATLISIGDYAGIRLNDFTGQTTGFYYTGSGWNTTATPQLAPNTGWHHLAYTIDGQIHTQTLFIDGIAKTTTTFTEPIGYTGLGTNTLLGRHGTADTNWDFKGMIDDLRVYNRALSQTEIQALANPTSPTPTPTPTPGPTPTACSLYTSSTAIPTGFASPYDVVSSPTTNLMNVTCDTASARLDLGKGDPLQYIYNQGYLFKTGGTNWTQIPYTSTEQLIANAWYPKSATTNITLTQTEIANPSYNLAYICSWTGTKWLCGCRDNICAQSYWQIQSFKR